jgi:hypothetical protein
VAEAAERADRFVGDEQDAVAIADVADALEVRRRRDEAAARVLDRLEEDGRDCFGSLLQDDALDVVGTGFGQLLALLLLQVCVGIAGVERAGNQRLVGITDRGNARDGERAERRPVVGDIACDDFVAVGLANIEIMEREDLPGRVLRNEDAFRSELETLYDLKFVGDIRGAGYFYGIELVKDSASQVRFTDEECKQLLGEILSPRTFELGLICRTEDKAEPVIQLAPPLVAGPEEFREIVRVLRQAISEAQEIMG